MGWNLKSPKILHIYWGGGIMTYIRFLTIKSFINQNPDWKIMFWYPKFPNKNMTWYTEEQKYDISQCTDFLPKLMNMPITKTSVDFRDYGFDNNISEVHKADFIRLELLSTIGGLWSDMDIFYFKPMNSLYLNTIENKNIETFYCDHDYGHSVGFLMSSEKNKFFETLKELSKREYISILYQSIGALTFNKYFSSFESINSITPAINISMDVVYAHNAGDVRNIINGIRPKFTNESIGVHWYAGSPLWMDFINKTNGGLNNLPDSIIGNLLKNYHEDIK